MTDRDSETPVQVAPPPFWKRHPKKLIVLAVFLALCSQMPLWGYLERVFLSMFQIGIVKGIEKQNDWLMRYFTGPPSDAEMIAHFQRHRADFERLAHLQITQGYCYHQEQLHPGRECTRLETKVGMRGGLGDADLMNSAFRNRRSPTCWFPCSIQPFYYPHKERQQRWGTKNPKIEAWEKELVYVPPLLAAERFGLNPKHYPSDSISAMRKKCFWKESLDRIPPELEADPGDHAYPNCAIRHIDGQWFLRLKPHNVLDF